VALLAFISLQRVINVPLVILSPALWLRLCCSVWGRLLICGRLAIGLFDLALPASAITNRPQDAIPPHIRRAMVIVKMLQALRIY
jgi:hypothetical protein